MQFDFMQVKGTHGASVAQSTQRALLATCLWKSKYALKRSSPRQVNARTFRLHCAEEESWSAPPQHTEKRTHAASRQV